jgi:hypothetical protein
MKNFVKSIAIAMVMSAFAFNASAQNVVTGISTDNFAECQKYLIANPNDTIRELKDRRLELVAWADTTLTRNESQTVISLLMGDKLFWAGYDVFVDKDGKIAKGNHYLVERINPLPAKAVADSSLVARVDAAAEVTQVNLISRSYGQEQDINFYQSSVHKTTDGKVVSDYMNKNGLSLVAGFGYRYGQGNLHSFTFEAGVQLTSDWGGFGRVTYRGSTTRHPDNAVDANGSYFTHGIRPAIGWRFALDTYATWNLELSAGPELDFQKTETAQNNNGLLQSNVFAINPFAEVGVTYEPFNSRVGFGFCIGWEQPQILKQNDGNAGKNCISAKFMLIVPLFK